MPDPFWYKSQQTKLLTKRVARRKKMSQQEKMRIGLRSNFKSLPLDKVTIRLLSRA